MSICNTGRRTVIVRRADSVRASDAVRHVDQLDETALTRFYEAVTAGGRIASVDEHAFDHGEIIVGNGYYRIEFA